MKTLNFEKHQHNAIPYIIHIRRKTFWVIRKLTNHTNDSSTHPFRFTTKRHKSPRTTLNSPSTSFASHTSKILTSTIAAIGSWIIHTAFRPVRYVNSIRAAGGTEYRSPYAIYEYDNACTKLEFGLPVLYRLYANSALITRVCCRNCRVCGLVEKLRDFGGGSFIVLVFKFVLLSEDFRC